MRWRVAAPHDQSAHLASSALPPRGQDSTSLRAVLGRTRPASQARPGTAPLLAQGFLELASYSAIVDATVSPLTDTETGWIAAQLRAAEQFLADYGSDRAA